MPTGDPTVVVAVIGGIVAIIGTIAGLVGALSKNSGDRRTAQELRLDARMDAAMTAQDRRIAEQDRRMTSQDETIAELQELLKRRLSAVANIFRAIRDQWVGDASGPNLDPADIAELEDTEVLPREWIRRHR